MRTSQRLSPRPQDLVSKRVKEQVEGYLLLPSSMRKGPAHTYGLSWWLSGEESPCQYRRHEFDPWVREILRRRKWKPTFIPGKSYG